MTGSRISLLERDRERACISDALAGAKRRSGSLLLLESGPGLGKSSLLDLAAEQAEALGVRVLRARGSEHEQALPFGGVLQLFEGVLRRCATKERERLLSGSAALAREIFDYDVDRDAPRPLRADSNALSIVHGLFWLAVNLSEFWLTADSRLTADSSESFDAGDDEENHPWPALALLIDDAHLLDPLSARFLAYLCPRLEDLPIAMLLAFRAPALDAPPELHAIRAEKANILHPAPLTGTGVEKLLHAEIGAEAVTSSLTDATSHLTGGNPFLVRELVAELRSQGLKRGEELASRVKQIAPDSVLRATLARLARLTPTASALAKALVVLGDGAPLGLAAALADVKPSEAALAADSLAAEGIFAGGGPLRFSHPLLSQALAKDLPPGRRAASELEAAKLLHARGEPAERVCTHLLDAAASGDAWVVEVLALAAERARSHGAPEIAAAYLKRALDEPPVNDLDRAQILSALAEAEAAAGIPDALTHLDAALESMDDPIACAELLGRLGKLLSAAGRHRDAIAAFERGLGRLEDGRQPLARELKASIACAGASGEASTQTLATVVAELRSVPAGGELEVELGVLALAAARAAIVGDPVSQFRPLALRAMKEGRLAASVREDAGLMLTPAAVALLYADELDRSLQLLDAALGHAQEDGSVLALATVSYLRAWPQYFVGAIDEAIADAEQALSAQRQGWSMHAGGACAVLAHATIERGDMQAAHAALAKGDSLQLAEGEWAVAALLVAHGRLLLAENDPDGAMKHLGKCADHLSRQKVSGRPIPWRGPAALASFALGDATQAVALAHEELDRAQRIGARRTLGMALRVCGLVEGGSNGLARLQAAQDVLEQSPAKLELARVLVDVGAAMRRSGARTESRQPLRRGLEMAHRFGAQPLAQYAREELLASGARPRRAAISGRDSLTPSERRVARLAAEGLTNRQIAQRLFVTTKTVEYHLRHVFQKLGIASRTELPPILAEDAVAQ